MTTDSAYRPIAMVRKQEQAAQFEAEGIATVFGDLAGDFENASTGVDKVIFAAGSAGDDDLPVKFEATGMTDIYPSVPLDRRLPRTFSSQSERRPTACSPAPRSPDNSFSALSRMEPSASGSGGRICAK